MKKRLKGNCSSFLVILFCLITFAACSSTEGLMSGEVAFVAVEKVRVRSSTAEAARSLGELKSGDQVTITERKNEGNTAWSEVKGPGGITGWIESKTLVKQEIVNASQKMAAEVSDIAAQAVGRSKARLKLRLTPDRTSEDNVAFELPAGSVVEIVARDRKPRPEKLDARLAQPGADASSAAPASTGLRYDDWYQVRPKNLSIVPVGWIYGGSVELEVPGDIGFFASAGRRITGWQSIGSIQDEQNQTKEHYLVAEKQLFGAEDQLDFDRLKVLAFDPKRREYVTTFREDARGRFPIHVKVEGNRGTLQITTFDKDKQPHKVDYSIEAIESGRPKVTRVTPKEAARKR
jgi:hypothetical protein